jgi:hypothetical protein
MEGLRKTIKYLSQENQSLDPDLNSGPLEENVGILLPQPRRSVNVDIRNGLKINPNIFVRRTVSFHRENIKLVKNHKKKVSTSVHCFYVVFFTKDFEI